MPDKNILLVFAGLPGSGKDTCLDYLKEKYNSKTYSFTDILKNAIDAFYLEFNRDNLIKISECIRETFGEDTLAKAMANKVKTENAQISAIGNARRPADIEYLSKIPGFVLIEIKAEMKTRYERVKTRGEKTSDAKQTFEQFKTDHQRSTELSILEIAKQATEHIDNNGSFDELYQQLDEIIKKYGN